jgi:hypothetical protein
MERLAFLSQIRPFKPPMATTPRSPQTTIGATNLAQVYLNRKKRWAQPTQR